MHMFSVYYSLRVYFTSGMILWVLIRYNIRLSFCLVTRAESGGAAC